MVEVSGFKCVCGGLKYLFSYSVRDELCSQPCKECAQCVHPSINLSNNLLLSGPNLSDSQFEGQDPNTISLLSQVIFLRYM